MRSQNHDKILQLNSDGWGTSSIAKQLQLSISWVEKVLKRNHREYYPTGVQVDVCWKDIQEICSLYEQGSTAKEILAEKDLRITENSIIKIIKLYGTKVRRRGNIPATLNENYFEEIDSPLKAYLLGWVFSDGSIICQKGHYRLALEIHKDDIAILYLLKQELNYTGNIHIRNNRPHAYINIYSDVLCKSLYDKGITQRKSKTGVPQINRIKQKYQRDYVRGIMDGDGCIHKNGRITFYGGNYEYIAEIADYIATIIGSKYNITDNKHGAYSTSISSKENIRKFVQHIYYPDCKCLERKHKILAKLIPC